MQGIVVARLLGDEWLLPTLQQYRLAGVGQVVDADGERAATAQCLELYLPLYLHNSLFFMSMARYQRKQMTPWRGCLALH